MDTLRFVASLPPGSEIAFCYSIPSESLTDGQRAARVRAAERVAAIGEPWISYYAPEELTRDLAALGFAEIRDFGPDAANDLYFSDRADGLPVSGSGRLMCARV